jgi:hypothetical protein
MMRTGIAISIALLIIACGGVSPVSGQAMFGVNFIGEHRFMGGARDRALASSTIAVPDTNNAVTMNPSTISGLSSMTLSLYQALGMGRTRTEDITVDQNRYQLPALMLSIPIRKGLALGIGYRTRFLGQGDGSIPQELGGGPTPYDNYSRSLALYTVPFTLAWRPVEWIMMSGALHIERGSIKDDITTRFEDKVTAPVSSKRERYYRGTSFGASFLIQPHERLSFGATIDGKIDYSVDEEFDYSKSSLDSTATSRFTLPPAFGAGAAFGITERWWISAAYWFRNAPEPSGFAYLTDQIRDENLIAVGFERRASAEGSFISRMPLRLGYLENRWHLQFPAGHDIIGRFLTLGFGFPMPGGPGALDFSVELGQIGSIEDNTMDERMVRLGLSISISEAWMRRKVDRH